MSALPRLDRALVLDEAFRARARVELPSREVLELPEKVVQFGTGAFLRGFLDVLIDDANRAGDFGGRIVAVGSTASGRDRIVNDQDGLFTLFARGIERGAEREERRIVASVSRALSAATEWTAVLECARNPALDLVVSNTTEVGIALDASDEPTLESPRSFPGKLTRFLFERAKAFDFDTAKGVAVVPCELIENNGQRLREIVLTLANRWKLDSRFGQWLDGGVPFYDTLVDRIVPGTPRREDLDVLERDFGYRDAMLTTSETYRLFAIRRVDAARSRQRAFTSQSGVVLGDDIAPYRERKVRLLNGGHTSMVAVALLAGCETVLDAVQHDLVGAFLRRAMMEEIVPSLDVPDAEEFALDVLDRFANPFIRHELFDITLHGTTKMKLRVVPSIVRYVEKTGQVPSCLALGFAAHLAFLRGDLQHARRRAGSKVPPDESGERITSLWAAHGTTPRSLVDAVGGDVSLWGVDLRTIVGFTEAVTSHLTRIVHDGAPAALESIRQPQGTQ